MYFQFDLHRSVQLIDISDRELDLLPALRDAVSDLQNVAPVDLSWRFRKLHSTLDDLESGLHQKRTSIEIIADDYKKITAFSTDKLEEAQQKIRKLFL